MRAPVCLADRRLLEDEPFASSFSSRRLKQKKAAPPWFLKKVSALVDKTPGGVRAVEEWIHMAFELDQSWEWRNYALRSKRGVKSRPSEKQLMCFVKFHWYLYSNQDAMRFLRSQKLGGYTHKSLVKEEPSDEPMSPLTEIAEDDEIPPISATLAVAAKFALPEQKFEPSSESAAHSESIPCIRTPIRAKPVKGPPASLPRRGRPRASAPVVLELPAPDDASSALLHMASLIAPPPPRRRGRPRASAPVVLELPPTEDASSALLPMASLLAPPPPRRRGRPRASAPVVLELPAPDDASSALLPRASLIAPLPRDIALVYSPPELATLVTHPVHAERTQLPIRPVNELRSNAQRLDVFTVPRLTELNVKREPSEERPESLRLLEPGEAPENWLALPVNDTDQTEDAQVLEIVSLPKPPLQRLPPIWAQSRQEVCESFDWFRSYQGGVYQHDGTVKGYFLSAFSAQRDCFQCGGKIIVSHGGGKAESAKIERGQHTTIKADDQRAQDLSIRALLENYRKNQPLVLLIDDKYEPFPFDLGSRGVYMAVLGFYKITHTWAEYQPSSSNASGRVVRYKFAFQWCEDQGQPWWLEDTPAEPSQLGDAGTPVMSPSAMIPTTTIIGPLKPSNLYSTCNRCSHDSPHVFRQAWACLNPTCRSFWIVPSSGHWLPGQLDYNPDFLTIIDLRPIPLQFRDGLLPKPPVLAPKDGITTTYAHTRGWHCRKCGRLSCRSAWEQYQCPNCKDTHKIIGAVRLAKQLMSIRPPISNKFMDSELDPWSFIERLETRMFNHFNLQGSTGRYQTFVLPEGKGKIHLIQTNRLANVEADRIFEAYQQQASDGTLHFRRWPLRSHKLRGPLLTNYFSQNSGETYHYVGGADNTVPFDRAPSAVLQARNLIEKRIHEALGQEYKFNEILSAAYMEQQKMAFHSDSERGLGPVVAGLSMGSPALMHFRLLSKYVPSSQQRANAMTVVLRHGDVLVMEGADVQNFYEHTVVPCNFRIAATARWIEPHHT